jgi:hypothetical protein
MDFQKSDISGRIFNKNEGKNKKVGFTKLNEGL